MAKGKKKAAEVKKEDDMDIEAEIDALENESGSGEAVAEEVVEELAEEVVEESAEEVAQEKPKTKKEGGKAIENDCRLCVHYPFNASSKPVMSLAGDLAKITSNFTKTFCGTKPFDDDKVIDDRINCKGKKFSQLESVK